MDRQHPAVALSSKVTQLLDDAGDVAVLGLAGSELDMLIEMQLTLMSRLHASLAEVLEQAALVDRPAAIAAPSMAAWLRGRFGLTPYSSHRLVRDVVDLRAAPIAAEAARFGAIPVQSAVEIGHAVSALPSDVGPEVCADGAAVLLGFAVGADGPRLDAHELRLAGRHLHEILDPDAADVLLAQRLEREEREVHRRHFLSITDDADSGGVRLRGLLTAEAGTSLRAVLGPLAAPRPARAPVAGISAPAGAGDGDHAHGENGTGSGDDENGGIGGLGGSGDLDENGGSGGPDGSGGQEPLPDGRSGGQRMADAIHEVCERLLAQGELPASGGDRPQLLITVDDRRLAAGVGAGTLPDGTQLAPGAVRRICCERNHPRRPRHGEPAPRRRPSARTATAAQRKALALRDGGCAFPGCNRPPSWSQAHHIDRWQDLGPTDLANLVLVCGFHHRTIHRDEWRITPAADGNRPLLTPLAWIDPRRRPRRNLQHHIRDLLRGSP